MVGAVLHSTARGQAGQTADTARVPVDTSRERVQAAPSDTLLAPLARGESGMPLRADQRLHWNRTQLDFMDVQTLQDLLTHVPGVTPLAAGWIQTPSSAACWSRIPCVRVFQDGVEMDELDPRANGVLDLSQFEMWAAQEVSVERTGDEVRVYIRTWQIDHVTPFTQTDIATGDQNTNLYRLFFGRGFANQVRMQIGVQQYGTTPPTFLGASSDELSALGRVGWAAANGLRVDAFLLTANRHRGTLLAFDQSGDSIPTLGSTRRLGYVRVGLGDPDTSGRWVQLVASSNRYSFAGQPAVNASGVADSVSTDTARTGRQYVIAAGVSRFGFRVSATERIRSGDGATLSTPSVRAEFARGPLQVSAVAEGRGPDSLMRADAAAEFDALPWLRFTGSVSASRGVANSDTVVVSASGAAVPGLDTIVGAPTSGGADVELGLRIRHDLWVSGGVLHRDSVRMEAPSVFSPDLARAIDGPATGAVAAVRGQLGGPWYLDVSAVRWNDSIGLYRPQYQTRAELTLKTDLIKRFPTGNFSFSGSIIHEYRSGTAFPLAGGGLAETSGYRTFSTLVAIRILRATITWRFSNTLGEKYFQVPGYLMPRISNFYGFRWVFWN